MTPHHLRTGNGSAPTVVLTGSLGTSLHSWDAQLAGLGDQYDCVAFDLPGHGRSPIPCDPFTVRDCAEDIVEVLNWLDIETFHVVGLSFGGAVGTVLATSWPDRVDRLVLAGTAPHFSDSAQWWRDRAAAVRVRGMGEVVAASSERWFTRDMARVNPVERDRLITQLATTPPAGYAACCDALAGYDGRQLLSQISAPTLVVAGELDPVTSPATLREVAALVDGARLRVVDDAAHLMNVEQPDVFTGLLHAHFIS